ncbi:uncharacterized protein LOC121865135 isoform X1 [Homarus americanus]|uniref:uncharacterized protein LOC121865135 isoform X1 n=1 Tax=Homarus americanus TaxID=6706 RepID=UPI001C462CEA|nr:uncharacterized protein LOC121865135 isoform X1 [Homarus americanus]
MGRRLLHLLLVLCTGGTLGQDPCTPDCSNMDPQDMVEDPNDCHRYYICLQEGHPSDHSIPCPAEHRFTSTYGDCVPDDGCTPSCTTPVSTTTSRACHYTCNSEGDLLTDPFDCNSYYLCHADGQSGPYICPEDRPYFNGQFCVENIESCCRDPCVVFCYPNNIQIPDPLDCRRFYICVEEGSPYEDHHYDCKPGMVMDPGVGVCVAGNYCQPQCTAQQAQVMAAMEEKLQKIADVTYDQKHNDYLSLSALAEQTELRRYEASLR